MGKHDDDDEKEEGGKEEELVSIRAFCHFVTSAKFRKELESFFSENCGGFEDAEIDGEQRLEWTRTFEDYVGVVETLLDDFCGIHQLDASTVFSAVREACRCRRLDEEFLPSALCVTEYPYFIEQMGLKATEGEFLRRVESSRDDFSGTWRIDANRTDVAESSLDRFLTASGVPKSLAGLFRGSLFSNKGLVLLRDRSSITIVADTVTGRHKRRFLTDGQRRMVSNVAGTASPWTATVVDDDSIVLRNDRPNGLPTKGSSVTQTYQLCDKGDRLTCVCEVRRHDGDVVSHDFVYKRAASGRGHKKNKHVVFEKEHGGGRSNHK